MHRKTNYTQLELEHIGTFPGDNNALNSLSIPTPIRRNNFHGAILRAAGAVGIIKKIRGLLVRVATTLV